MKSTPISNRYEALLLIECVNSNPNGDPDAGNLPRQDPVSGKGFITDACIKRKIRKELTIMHGEKPGMRMYIQAGEGILNEKDNEALTYLGVSEEKPLTEAVKEDPDLGKKAVEFMCQNYFDIRAFGGVMTGFSKGGLCNGAVTGPVQISIAESVSPIFPQTITQTRVVVASEKEDAKHGTMAPRHFVPYGLYVVKCSIDPFYAKKTGFSEEDLDKLWDAMENMFRHDKAVARTGMSVRKFIIFRHNTAYGCAHDYELFERLKISEKVPGAPVTCIDDYDIELDNSELPAGVAMLERI